jgi:Fe-S-cluster containining protein
MYKALIEQILFLLHHDLPGNRIVCFRCGVCCRFGAPLGFEETADIAGYTGLPITAFLNGTPSATGYETVPDVIENYSFRRNDDGCIFLHAYPETGEIRCGIHPVRPPACRGYAPEIDREACITGLKKRWGLTVTPKLSLKGNEKNLTRFYVFLRTITGG